MLRALVLALVAANAAFFVWSRGWVDGITGVKASGDREPQRLAQQVHPERVTLMGPQALTALKQTACVALGPLDGDAALTSARAALMRAGMTPDAYRVLAGQSSGVWAVATIRLDSKDFQARKEETYQHMHIAYEYLSGVPAEMPSLVLSRHPSEKAAEAELAQLTRRALKGLRVLQLQAPTPRASLVFAQADGLLQTRLHNLKDATLAATLHDCSADEASISAPDPAGAAPAPASAAAASTPVRPASGPSPKAG